MTTQAKANLAINVQSITILSGTATSEAISQSNGSLVAISFPSTLDGTALTFTGCDTVDGTYVAVIGSDGASLAMTVAASKLLALTEAQQAQLRGIPFLKLVMGTNQSSTDTIVKVFRRAV